jgi:hypothetical protein
MQVRPKGPQCERDDAWNRPDEIQHLDGEYQNREALREPSHAPQRQLVAE